MKFKKYLVALSITGSVLLGGLAVNAGTTWGAYETAYVPGNNGFDDSSVQNKSKTNASSDLYITKQTNPNSVDVRAYGGVGMGTGAWVRNVNTGSFSIPNPVQSGAATQLGFSTDAFSNSASITFKWRSN